jgi:hypothetical protein
MPPPPVYRPVPAASQQETASLATSARSGAPPVYRPCAPTSQVKHGQQLFGHELTHVMLQRQGRVRNPIGAGAAVVQERALEAEVERFGHRAAAHRTAVQARIAVTRSRASANEAARASTIQPMSWGTGIGAVVSLGAWATGWGALVSLVPAAVGIAVDYYMRPCNGMTLEKVGSPVDLERIQTEVYGKGQPTGLAAGVTPPPKNSRAPHYKIDFVSDQGGHRARLRLTQNAWSGTNICEYLTTGVYHTNRFYNASDHQQFGGGVSNYLETTNPSGRLAKCYFVMPADIAQLNKQAEEEHAHDYIFAYVLTLGKIQGILENVGKREYGPYPTRDKARQALEEDIREQIQAWEGFRDLSLNMTTWKKKFEELCKGSKKRDTNNWHSWGLELITDPQRLPSSLPDPNGVYMRYTKGTTEVGTHPSDEIITT